jgi:uncharacterized membrane-anchored protein YjiN (DUF445 family)
MTLPRTRRNRWGSIFLILAAAGFAVFTFQPWWPSDQVRFFRAFFEASLVGALADWFAVTALFRRPLGLPLPHTDVLVKRKDQLVEALPKFLGSFLEPDKLNPVFRSIDWAAVVVDKLEPEALDALFARGLSAVADAPSRTAWESGAVQLAASLVHRELSRHQESLVGPITDVVKRNAGWKGLFVGRDTIEEAVEGVLDELAAVRDSPDHALRRTLTAAFHDAWPRWAENLQPSRWTAEPWKRLETDPEFREAFNRNAGDLAVAVWEKSHAAAAVTGALGYLLAQTDARSLATRIEASVGNDLQYIRVNGALVGGLAGLGLELARGWRAFG